MIETKKKRYNISFSDHKHVKKLLDDGNNPHKLYNKLWSNVIAVPSESWNTRGIENIAYPTSTIL